MKFPSDFLCKNKSTTVYSEKKPYDNTVGNIPENTIFYTVPWAIMINKDGDTFINVDYQVTSINGGTATMRVIKVFGNYVVDISGCKCHCWNESDGADRWGAKVSLIIH